MNIEQMSASEFSKYKLIMAAIRLFGERGVNSVSLREINREAGAKNNSALHYHFDNKMGLTAAVIGYIQNTFDEERASRFAELELLHTKKKKITAEQIMRAFVEPYVSIINNYDWGYSGIRAISWMEFDGNAEVHELLSKHAGPSIKKLYALFKSTLPQLPAKVLKQRLNFVVNAVIYGFADYKNLHQSYLGNLAVKDLDTLVKLYTVQTAAAISAPIPK